MRPPWSHASSRAPIRAVPARRAGVYLRADRPGGGPPAPRTFVPEASRRGAARAFPGVAPSVGELSSLGPVPGGVPALGHPVPPHQGRRRRGVAGGGRLRPHGPGRRGSAADRVAPRGPARPRAPAPRPGGAQPGVGGGPVHADHDRRAVGVVVADRDPDRGRADGGGAARREARRVPEGGRRPDGRAGHRQRRGRRAARNRPRRRRARAARRGHDPRRHHLLRVRRHAGASPLRRRPAPRARGGHARDLERRPGDPAALSAPATVPSSQTPWALLPLGLACTALAFVLWRRAGTGAPGVPGGSRDPRGSRRTDRECGTPETARSCGFSLSASCATAPYRARIAACPPRPRVAAR